MTREWTMDRAGDRLLALHLRMRGLWEDWDSLDPETRKRQFYLIQQDYANTITPAMREAWRLFAAENGIVVSEENKNVGE